MAKCLYGVPYRKSRFANGDIHTDNGQGIPVCGDRRWAESWQPVDDEPTCAKCIRLTKPRPMTLAQARAEAQKRWGNSLNVSRVVAKREDGECKIVITLVLHRRKSGRAVTQRFDLYKAPTFEAIFSEDDRRHAAMAEEDADRRDDANKDKESKDNG